MQGGRGGWAWKMYVELGQLRVIGFTRTLMFLMVIAAVVE